MKSAYELAMERLSKASPTVKLTDAQKKQLAELDSLYAAKIAERELALKGELTTLEQSGEVEKLEQVQQRWVTERKALQAELEEKKEAVRQQKRAK